MLLKSIMINEKLSRRIHREDITHDGDDETCLSLQGDLNYR